MLVLTVSVLVVSSVEKSGVKGAVHAQSGQPNAPRAGGHSSAHDGPAGMKERDDVNLLLHEETFIHLFELNERIKTLEGKFSAHEQ